MDGTEAGGVVASYLLLRKAIGWIGTLFPIVLIVGDAAFTSVALSGSVSGYYYTPMRNIFVGSLCVLGVFLLLYDVGVPADRRITNVAGAGAIGVAFFPTTPLVAHPSTTEHVVGDLHLFFAGVAFAALGVTAWRFAQAGSDGKNTPAPSQGAAAFYRACGVAILAFAVLAALAELLPASVKGTALLVYDFESLAIITFGVSWLVKGRALHPLLRTPLARRLLPGLSMPQEDQVDNPEYQDNSHVYQQTRPELVPQEQDVYAHDDGYHHEHVGQVNRLAFHSYFLLCASE